MADDNEREVARLFRVSRTAHELVRDRVRSAPSPVRIPLPSWTDGWTRVPAGAPCRRAGLCHLRGRDQDEPRRVQDAVRSREQRHRVRLPLSRWFCRAGRPQQRPPRADPSRLVPSPRAARPRSTSARPSLKQRASPSTCSTRRRRRSASRRCASASDARSRRSPLRRGRTAFADRRAPTTYRFIDILESQKFPRGILIYKTSMTPSANKVRSPSP